MRRQTVNRRAGIGAGRLLPPRFFQISTRTGGFGNGINHGDKQNRKKFAYKLELLVTRRTFFTKRDLNKLNQGELTFSLVDKFRLSGKGQTGRVKLYCRPRAVLETARFLSVALPARLSLDLNDSPTSIQLGLHKDFSRILTLWQRGFV